MVDVLVAAPLRLELHWEQGVLAETVLGWAGEGEKPVLLTEEARSVQACLVRYVAGEDVEWPSLPLAWDRVTPFRRRVLQALVADVPAGAVTTYGDLAARAGSPPGPWAGPWPTTRGRCSYPATGCSGEAVGLAGSPARDCP